MEARTNSGTSVEEILEKRFKDVDEDAQPGIAVIAVDEQFGEWQYRCPTEKEDEKEEEEEAKEEEDEAQETEQKVDAGVEEPVQRKENLTSGWRSFRGSDCVLKQGVKLSVERATLLPSSCFLRFLPKRDFNFESEENPEFPSVDVLAWDGSDNINNNQKYSSSPSVGVDVSAHNMTHLNAFSSSSYKVSVILLLYFYY